MTAQRVIAAIALAVSLAVPAVACGQTLDPSTLSAEQREAIGDLFTRARAAYEAGNFLEAVELLERAHRIFPEPNIIYRIGDAYESAGDLEDAGAEPAETRWRDVVLRVVGARVEEGRVTVLGQALDVGRVIGRTDGDAFGRRPGFAVRPR